MRSLHGAFLPRSLPSFLPFISCPLFFPPAESGKSLSLRIHGHQAGLLGPNRPILPPGCAYQWCRQTSLSPGNSHNSLWAGACQVILYFPLFFAQIYLFYQVISSGVESPSCLFLKISETKIHHHSEIVVLLQCNCFLVPEATISWYYLLH